MLEISLDTAKRLFEVNSYNGNSAKREIHQLSSYSEDFSIASKWNFFRQEDNHAYVKGKISYEGDCKNNLIISPYKNNRLFNVENAFIFVDEGDVEISPISNISNAINKGKKALSNQEVSYNIPKTVFERENLTKKDFRELRKETEQKYEIKIDKISIMDCEKTNNKIYYIKSEDEREYVLKFRGMNKEKAELFSKITQDIQDYFPLNFRRKDNGNFTFEIAGELYGLEEFVRSHYQKSRNLEYFSSLGSHMGLLHNQFSNFLVRNKGIERILVSSGNHTSESNLISFYLDLMINRFNNRTLISELEMIIKKDLGNQMSFLPTSLIHGDLNHSNLIWQRNNLKIVDSETIKNSTRLNEFESPLLFEGNMTKPEYVRNSLKVMIHAYNQSSKMPLSKKEIKVLPYLLKYALLRNFVVRKIRRKSKDENYLDEIIENLKLIDEDSQ